MKIWIMKCLAFLLSLCVLVAAVGCVSVKVNRKINSKENKTASEKERDEEENITEDEGAKDIHLNEEIPVLDMETAERLISCYNVYSNFGVCNSFGNAVDRSLTDEILMSAGYNSQYLEVYSVQEVSCCSSLDECNTHIREYLSDSIVDTICNWECNPVEYEGKLYSVAAAMGYGGFYINGELVQESDTVASVALGYDYEEEVHLAVFKYSDSKWKLSEIVMPVLE